MSLLGKAECRHSINQPVPINQPLGPNFGWHMSTDPTSKLLVYSLVNHHREIHIFSFPCLIIFKILELKNLLLADGCSWALSLWFLNFVHDFHFCLGTSTHGREDLNHDFDAARNYRSWMFWPCCKKATDPRDLQSSLESLGRFGFLEFQTCRASKWQVYNQN